MPTMSSTDLSGRTAIVTGASSGFGWHFSGLLAAQGAHVVAIARRAERLEALVKDIAARGGRATALPLDVSKADKVARAFAELPPIDIVINNAGVAGLNRAIDCGEDEWRWTYDVNVNATWFVARAAATADDCRPTGRGSIVNIASITGVRPGAVAAAYSSSKAAVIQLTKATGYGNGRGMTSGSTPWLPGYFETELNRDFLLSDFGQSMMRRIPSAPIWPDVGPRRSTPSASL